jgi:hypothetical protein
LVPRAWYDAGDASSVVSAAGVVSRWVDKFNRYDLTPTATGPSWGTLSWGGLPVVDFGGSNTLANTVLPITQPFTVFLTVSRDAAGFHAIVERRSGSEWIVGPAVSSNTYEAYAGNVTATLGVKASPWGPEIHTVIFNGTSSQIRRNGVVADTGDSGAATNTTGINVGRSWDGALGDLLIYGGVATPQDCAKVEGYLAYRRGLPLSTSACSPPLVFA